LIDCRHNPTQHLSYLDKRRTIDEMKMYFHLSLVFLSLYNYICFVGCTGSSPSQSELFGISSIIHFCSGDICFSPFVIYGAIMVGCFAQVSICGLCCWVLITGRKVRRLSQTFAESSRASITSKTGLYHYWSHVSLVIIWSQKTFK